MKFVEPGCIAVLAVTAIGTVTLRAEAAPLPTHVDAVKAALDAPIVHVRHGRWHGGWGGGYRGWGHRGWGYRGWGHRGWGVGAAAAGSAYYGGYPYYGGGYPYYGGGYAYESEYCPPFGGYHRSYDGW